MIYDKRVAIMFAKWLPCGRLLFEQLQRSLGLSLFFIAFYSLLFLAKQTSCINNRVQMHTYIHIHINIECAYLQ